MDHMITCKKRDRELLPNSAVPISPAVLYSVSRSLFWFSTLLFWFTVIAHILLFFPRQAADFSKTSLKHHLHSTGRQTGTVGDELVNIVEHLAAKQPNISFRSWWSPKSELKEE